MDKETEQAGYYFKDENIEIEEAQWIYTSGVKDYKIYSEVTYKKNDNRLFLLYT